MAPVEDNREEASGCGHDVGDDDKGLQDGRMVLVAAGHGYHGQLGLGLGGPSFHLRPVVALLRRRVVRVAAGYMHSLALDDKGRVYAWGGNAYGVLGVGSNQNSNVPHRVCGALVADPDDPVVDIACGWAHSAAVTSKGAVYTWGAGFGGRLGHGDTIDRWEPARVEALRGTQAIAVHCGGNATTVLCESGRLFQWGWWWDGAMPAKNVNEFDAQPRLVDEIKEPVRDVSCGGDHVCAVTESGAVWQWGLETTVPPPPAGAPRVHRTAQRVPGVENARAVACSHRCSAVVTRDGALLRWGTLGDGDEIVTTPTQVDMAGEGGAPLVVEAVSLGGRHALAVARQGDGADARRLVVGWGSNLYGQLASEVPVERSPPRIVHELSDLVSEAHVHAIACGYQHTLALLEVRGARSDALVASLSSAGSVAPLLRSGEPPSEATAVTSLYSHAMAAAAAAGNGATTGTTGTSGAGPLHGGPVPSASGPSSTPSSSASSSDTRASIVDGPTSPLVHVVLVDLDNTAGHFLHTLDAVPPEGVSLYIFGGPVLPKLSLDFLPVFSRMYADNRLVLVRAEESAANASDFALAFYAGQLHATLPRAIPFTVLSNDRGLNHTVQMIQRLGRPARRVSGPAVDDVDIVFGAVAPDGGLRQPRDWRMAPIKSPTVAEEDGAPEAEAGAAANDGEGERGALSVPRGGGGAGGNGGGGRGRRRRKSSSTSGRPSFPQSRVERGAQKVAEWLQALPPGHRPKTEEALGSILQRVSHLRRNADLAKLRAQLEKQGILHVQDGEIVYGGESSS